MHESTPACMMTHITSVRLHHDIHHKNEEAMLNFHAVYTKVNVTKNCQAGQLQLNSYSSASVGMQSDLNGNDLNAATCSPIFKLQGQVRFLSEGLYSYIFPNCPWLGLKNV